MQSFQKREGECSVIIMKHLDPINQTNCPQKYKLFSNMHNYKLNQIVLLYSEFE